MLATFHHGGLLIRIDFDWAFLYHSFATPVAGSIISFSTAVPAPVAVGQVGTLFRINDYNNPRMHAFVSRYRSALKSCIMKT